MPLDSAHTDLLARRATHVDGLAGRTYLGNHTLGAPHADSALGLARYAREWAEEGITAWRRWVPEMRRVADLAGALIGAPAGTTVLRQSVHDGLADIAAALPLEQRPRVVLADLEWPGTRYLWQANGAELASVAVSDDGTHVDVGRLADAVDERTAAVFLSHVLFRTSTLVDPTPVVEAAHRVGALVVLDAYQSAGAVPVDVTALGVDVCVGGSVKFLCGGPGNGFLYVAPHAVAALRPRAVGWFGHARPFAFDESWEPAPGAHRFTGGTPNVPAAYAAAPAFAELLDIGVDRVRERSLSLTQPLVEACLERGWAVRSPVEAEQRGGSVTVDPGDSLRVHDALLARGVVVDHRPGAGLRIGPHWFSTAEEVAHVVEEIAALTAAGRPASPGGAGGRA